MSDSHFHPIILYSEESKALHDALVSSGYGDLASNIARKAMRSTTDRKYIDALQLWDGETFNVDDQPVVSISEDGAHVMIWQWISRQELDSDFTE